MTKNVAVFTGTRAEYGLLYWLLRDIQADEELGLKLLVSGMHLSPEFGCTYTQIEKDGFTIDEKIEILLSSDSAVGVAKSIGLGILGFADALNRLKPDCIVILGDRFEALAAAQTAMILRIPILHVHGGEITEGAYDDSIRHAISKLSFLHAVSTEEHKDRVIQLGENPLRVRNVGAVGLDHLMRTEMMTLEQVSKFLCFKLVTPYFLVTYHPVTLADEDPCRSFESLIESLDNFPDYQVVITYPNADDGGRKIIPILEAYAKKNPLRVFACKSLGQQCYLSAVKHASAIVGNSSSGVIEVPSFNVPTVNIGKRQKGRMAAKSVIHCDADSASIIKAIQIAVEKSYKGTYELAENPYGSGNASVQIIEMIKSLDGTLIKEFYDLKDGAIV